MAHWIVAEDDDLVNLDGARYIGVRSIDEPENPEHTHALVALFPDDDSVWLDTGSEQQMKQAQGQLFVRLRAGSLS